MIDTPACSHTDDSFKLVPRTGVLLALVPLVTLLIFGEVTIQIKMGILFVNTGGK